MNFCLHRMRMQELIKLAGTHFSHLVMCWKRNCCEAPKPKKFIDRKCLCSVLLSWSRGVEGTVVCFIDDVVWAVFFCVSRLCFCRNLTSSLLTFEAREGRSKVAGIRGPNIFSHFFPLTATFMKTIHTPQTCAILCHKILLTCSFDSRPNDCRICRQLLPVQWLSCCPGDKRRLASLREVRIRQHAMNPFHPFPIFTNLQEGN